MIRQIDANLYNIRSVKIVFASIVNTKLGDVGLEKGWNSDLSVGGNSYHVQTEDWGKDNPYIVSRVFKNGAVVQSLKTPYSQVVSGIFFHPNEIKNAIKKQHELILDQLLTGKLI